LFAKPVTCVSSGVGVVVGGVVVGVVVVAGVVDGAGLRRGEGGAGVWALTGTPFNSGVRNTASVRNPRIEPMRVMIGQLLRKRGLSERKPEIEHTWEAFLKHSE
jgi:hypothetical protein